MKHHVLCTATDIAVRLGLVTAINMKRAMRLVVSIKSHENHTSNLLAGTGCRMAHEHQQSRRFRIIARRANVFGTKSLSLGKFRSRHASERLIVTQIRATQVVIRVEPVPVFVRQIRSQGIRVARNFWLFGRWWWRRQFDWRRRSSVSFICMCEKRRMVFNGVGRSANVDARNLKGKWCVSDGWTFRNTKINTSATTYSYLSFSTFRTLLLR